MKRSRFFLFHPLWLAAALLAGLMLALTMTSARALPDSPESPSSPADAPGGIEGTLYEHDGSTTVEDGNVVLHDENGEPLVGTLTASDGRFSFTELEPGEYILRAFPPPSSPDASSLPVIVQVSSGLTSTQDILLTEVRVGGYVRDCNAIPEFRIKGADVVVHTMDWSVEQWSHTNISGEFKIGGVAEGTEYILDIFPPEGSDYMQPDPLLVTPITTGMVLELCIPPTNVVGIVNDPDGKLVNGAWVVIWNDFYWDETGAELGNFLFRGLPEDLLPGEFWIHAGPPWGEGGEGLISSEPFTIVVPTPPLSVSVMITLPHAYKTVTGHVVLAGPGDGVPNAEVRAWRLDGPGFAGELTDPTGAFTMSLTGGEWHIGVEPATWPVEWIFPGPPAWVFFEQNTEPETRTVTLEVIPTNAWVEGHIVCPGGPCPGGLHERIWVELRNGIANGARPNEFYDFSIPIPDGWYELVVHVEHPELQGPEPIPVFVGPNQHLILTEPIVLLHKNATITGTVYAFVGGKVEGIAGVHIVGWKPEGFGWGWAETDASGHYTMPVIGGEWFVEPHPAPDTDYVYIQRPRRVRVAPHGTQTGVDFGLIYAGARIRGAAVDAVDGHRLWGLDGWASAHVLLPSEERFFSDAPLWDGGFELKARGGFTYAVGLHLPPYADYVSGGAGPIPVAPGALVTITVPLEHKDAAIEGRLLISGTSNPALGVWAEVFGEDENGNWGVVRVDEGSAEYGMEVVSGTWHLRAWVDPESGYLAAPTPKTVNATSGNAVGLDFDVVPIGSYIEGQVLQPDGITPVTDTIVFARGESPLGYFETMTETNLNGEFHLKVPLGEYVVGAGMPVEEMKARYWLPPPPIEGVNPPTTTLELQYIEVDGRINGTIRFDTGINVTPTHPAFVWGWSESGTAVEAVAMTDTVTTFTYTLPVVTGEVWHVGAVYEDPENGLYYESAEAIVSMSSDTFAQDLTLGGPCTMPQPLIVSFDGTQMQTIVLPDGVELSIPPGALVVSGTVTLFIFPTREMRPEPGHELIGAGYEIWAVDQNGQEITHFNQNVMMTFHYPPDPELALHGVSEYMLIPVYYSTLAGHWILADNYVVDTINNEITLQISHFTKFGLASTGPAEYKIYLPLVLKGFGG